MPEAEQRALARIGEKLAQLRARDRKFAILGAPIHLYRLGPPLGFPALRTAEDSLGIEIPEGYRAFLSQVGHGGAGPHHGLFRLDHRESEDLTDFDRVSRPFPWTEAFNADAAATEDEEYLGMSLPGALYVTTSGAGLYYFVVTMGPCRGEVWHDFRVEGSGVFPATDGAGRRMGFVEWYEAWLDDSLRLLDRQG
jgi:hypothetical protein